MLHARADERGVRLEQRHSLTLHVRAHEGAVRIVVLEERDERRCDRRHLTRGNVHVSNLLGQHLFRLAEHAGGVLGTAEHARCLVEHAVGVGGAELAGLEVERLVRLGDRVVLLLVGREVVDVVGHLAVDHTTVGRLNEAVGVNAAERRERADKADVRAFRRLDRAHAAVVGVVDVADFEACALAGQTARAECGQTALVRDACGEVRLVHELRELGASEELLDGSHNRADVHERLRGDLVRLLHAHALAHDALHAGEADAELVLDELADRADAAVAEVVDVVDARAFLAGMQRDDVFHRGSDVLVGQGRGVVVGVEAELLVDLVAADFRQVVTLGVEEQALKQRTRGVDRGRLARTEALVQLDKGLFLGGSRVAIEGAQHHFIGAQKVDDLLARLGKAEGTDEQRGRLLALAVDAHGEDVALVGLELEPCAAARDDLRVVDGLVRRLVALGREVHARGANELGDDDALCAVDDEGTAVRHEREVAHEHVLFLDFARLTVDEANFHEQGRLIRDVLLLALIDGVLRLAELMLAELHAHVFRAVLDRSDVLESLLEAFFLEPLEAIRLDCDKIGDVHYVRNLREASAIPIKAGGSASFCFGHEAFPPSRTHSFPKKVAIEKDTMGITSCQEIFLRAVEVFCSFGL